MRKDVVIVEGSLEVKLRQNGQMKSRDGKSQRREEKRRTKKIKEEKVRRKKIQVREKVGKSRNTIFFPMICGSGGSKGRLAKAAGAEPSGQMRDDKLHAVVAQSTSASQNVQSTSASEHFWKLRCRTKCTPLWCEAHFQVKMYKRPQLRSTFGSCDVEKVHAIVRFSYNSTTLQLQLHHTALHPDCNHSKKTRLQPPFGPSVDSLCHPFFATTNLSYRFPDFWNFRRRLVRHYWYICNICKPTSEWLINHQRGVQKIRGRRNDEQDVKLKGGSTRFLVWTKLFIP